MNTTRRDLLKLAGGSAVGVLFTPVPWRLITDTALWSENWPGIPAPPRGEISARFTNCPLCPAGCAVRARCAGGRPVSLAGVAGHPLSRGALCPFGLTGHHLPYHPARLKQGPVEEAAAAVSDAMTKCAPGERVAVLDLRPGRTASWTYRRAMAAAANGVYLAPAHALGGAVAVDLAQTKTILSFGAPLFDGWGTPGNVNAHRARFRLIQAEPVESRTAVLADLWLPIRPGTEPALALGIAHLLGGAQAAEFTPAKTAAETGLSEAQIAAVAKELAENGPALVLDAAESPEVLALNHLVGSAGRTIVARPESPVPEAWRKSAAPVTDLADVPDHSIRVLLIDESMPGDYLPWRDVEKKLVRDNPLVVAFAWSRMGYGRYAHYVLPTAVYPEAAGDIPPAIDSPAAAFRLTAPLIPPPGGVVYPAAFIAERVKLAAGDALRERADAIHKAGHGTLFTYADAKSTPVKEVKPDDFWKALNEGGCWIGERGQGPGGAPAAVAGRGWGPRAEALEASSDLPLIVSPTESCAASAPGSPILSKLYQESGLRLAPNQAALHPSTARACGIPGGGRALLETRYGKCAIDAIVDPAIPPGMVQVAARPGILDVCAPGARAKVVAA
ncbi:MAG: hypothetical protein LAP87_26650 [Acidobacteriia bacterium]|nr:hypothetical protein [Terriglobia bacterium]